MVKEIMEIRYKIINKFECCGRSMVIVIISKRAACVMTELEYNKIMQADRKYNREFQLKIA